MKMFKYTEKLQESKTKPVYILTRFRNCYHFATIGFYTYKGMVCMFICVCVYALKFCVRIQVENISLQRNKNQLSSKFSLVNQISRRQGNNIYNVLRGKGHDPIILCPTKHSLVNTENRKAFLCN